MKIPVITYHDFSLGKDKKSNKKTKYTISLKKFEKHLKYLKNKGYKTVLLKDLNSLKNNKEKSKKVCLTFDDGYSSHHKAYKLLLKYGFRGSFFIPSGFIGKKSYLNKKQIKEMAREGMEIGSHSHSHCNLTKLKKKEIEKEIKKSKEDLEKIIGRKISSFCIPGGNYNKEVLSEIFKQGFNFVRTSDYGYFSTKRKVVGSIPVLDYPIFRKSFVLFNKNLFFFWSFVNLLKAIKKH